MVLWVRLATLRSSSNAASKSGSQTGIATRLRSQRLRANRSARARGLTLHRRLKVGRRRDKFIIVVVVDGAEDFTSMDDRIFKLRPL
jgi:hypothetical protein